MNCCDSPSISEFSCLTWRHETCCKAVGTPAHRHRSCGSCGAESVRLLPPPPPPKPLIRQILDGDHGHVRITFKDDV